MALPNDDTIPVGNTGEFLRTFAETIGGKTVQIEAVAVADPENEDAVAKVTDAEPASSDYGIVARIVGPVHLAATPTIDIGIVDQGTPGASPWLTTETNSAAIAASASVLDDWDESDRAKVNPIVGQAGVDGGNGAVTAKTIRVTSASDDPAVTQLAAILAAIQALSIAAAVPLLVHSGETYEVPTNTQVAFATQMVAEAGGIILTTGTGTLTWVD